VTFKFQAEGIFLLCSYLLLHLQIGSFGSNLDEFKESAPGVALECLQILYETDQDNSRQLEIKSGTNSSRLYKCHGFHGAMHCVGDGFLLNKQNDACSYVCIHINMMHVHMYVYI
jgi:hypothetical protein